MPIQAARSQRAAFVSVSRKIADKIRDSAVEAATASAGCWCVCVCVYLVSVAWMPAQ